MSYIELSVAKEEGFTIDEHSYPWVAYKGSRFSPTEWHYTQTDKEAELVNLCCELYLVLGALDAPVHVLDKVSAAANGDPIPDIQLIPFTVEPK